MKSKKKFWHVLLIIFIVFFLVSALYLMYIFGSQLFLKNRLAQHQNTSSHITSTEVLVENPINFKPLQETNSEIYAWVRVPNTNIDYPIAQSNTDDSYYIHHDIYGKWIYSGTLYTEMQNRKDFSDPNTVIYGHNMSKGYMFHNLSFFQDKEFFNKTREFYIFTPGHILTYTVFAAYKYDTRHILNSFDFTNEQVFADYIESAKNPASMVKNVREDVMVTTKDKIVTLYTCYGTTTKNRYLVQGVLTNDQKTY